MASLTNAVNVDAITPSVQGIKEFGGLTVVSLALAWGGITMSPLTGGISSLLVLVGALYWVAGMYELLT